jgi:hypothetical protein
VRRKPLIESNLIVLGYIGASRPESTTKANDQSALTTAGNRSMILPAEPSLIQSGKALPARRLKSALSWINRQTVLSSAASHGPNYAVTSLITAISPTYSCRPIRGAIPSDTGSTGMSSARAITAANQAQEIDGLQG